MSTPAAHQHTWNINNDGDAATCGCGAKGHAVFIESRDEEHAQQLFDRLVIEASSLAQTETQVIASAVAVLTHAIQTDPELAWAWHCNVAMAQVDEGRTHTQANHAAARFMRAAFGIDITQSEQWRALNLPPKEMP